MKKIYFQILVISLFAIRGIAQTTTVTLPCAKSVELFSLNPDSSQAITGYIDQINANAWTYSGTPGFERSLLDFDLTQIPVGATIISAYVNLYNNYYCNNDAFQNGEHSHVTNSNESWLQRVASAWTESTATWNNQPSIDTTGEVTLLQDTDVHQNYHIDVTALVQSMYASGVSHGFMLSLKNEQHYACLLFASSRHSDVTLRPTLEVTYQTETCVTLPASQSVELFSLNPDTPQYTLNTYYDQLNSNAWTYSGTPGFERSLLDFDLTQIPSNASITSAHVNLYNNYYCNNDAYQNGEHSHITNSNESWLQRVTSTWSETTATWNNQPTTDVTGQVALAQDTDVHQNYSVDVTSLVQSMHAGPPSYGFMLRLQNEQHYACLLFASSRHPDTTLRPTLEVCYKFSPETVFENDNLNSIIIYPNPSNGSFIIALQRQIQKSIVQIFNSIGQEIYSDNISNSVSRKEINLDAAAGIYFVRVSDGKKVFTQKLLIK